MAMVEEITAEAEVGAVYTGTVARIVDFGAFINILPGKDGLVHISQIASERVESVSDYLKEREEVRVKVLDVDQRGRIKRVHDQRVMPADIRAVDTDVA